MRRFLAFLFLSFALLPLADAEIKQIKTEGKITKVILYRNQAMVMRDIVVPVEAGEYAVEISNLPKSIIDSSVFASSKEVKIISVRFMVEHIEANLPKDKFSQIEKRLKEIDVEFGNIETRRATLKDKQAFMGKLELQYISKLGPSTTALNEKDTCISGFDFKTIAEMTDFTFKQKEILLLEMMAMEAEQRKLLEEREKENEKMRALRIEFGLQNDICQQSTNADCTPDKRNTVYKAIIYLAKEKVGTASFCISYLVENASWNPAYNMRTDSTGKELSVEYIAHINQTTGEDWNAVTVTLSTATPSMNAEVPILAPMWIKLNSGGGASSSYSFVPTDNLLAKNKMTQTANASNFKLFTGKNSDENDGNINFNLAANELQCVEFSNKKEILRRWYEDVRKIEQQMAVEYRLSDKVTIASRNDRQILQILAKTFPCSLYYEAVPLLATFVSRGIEAVNSIEQPLLAGEYSAFVDGQYVGQGKLPVTATGQFITLGFGIDPQLRCRRELLDKTASKSWGERTETYSYRLSVDNYKTDSISLRLLDRIPVTKDKGLTITLKDGADRLSKEAEYEKFELPKGMLRWDVNIPPSSFGAKTFYLDYSVDMEFDSDMRISAQGQEIREQLRNDILDFEERRKK